MKTHHNNHIAQAGVLTRWLSFPALLLICALATSARANDNYEYIDLLTSPADTNGWYQFVDYSTATFTITNGGYRLQSGPGGSFGTYPGPYGVGLIYTNFQVSIDVIDWKRSLYPTNLGNICLAARGSGLTESGQYGYIFSLQPNDTNNDGTGVLYILSVSGSAPPVVEASLSSVPINVTNSQYRLVFNGSGAVLTGSLFNLTNLTQPIATIQATNTTYPSGAVAIAAYDGAVALGLNPLPVDFTVNNFSAGPVTPLLNIQQTVTLSWPDSYAGYILQSAISLSGPWQPLSVTPRDNAGLYTATVAATNSSQFFRLVDQP